MAKNSRVKTFTNLSLFSFEYILFLNAEHMALPDMFEGEETTARSGKAHMYISTERIKAGN